MSFWGDDFDLLKSMEVRNLVGLLSCLIQFDRVYQDWFVWNSVGGLFQRQASRQSVKALVVSVPLLPRGAKPNSLSAGCGCVSPVCMIQPAFCYVFFPGISLLYLSLPLLRLGCKSTFLSPGFCVQKPRQYNMISCEFDHFSVFFFLIYCFGGWSHWMWLVSCRRQGMLTQGPAPNPKCKLSISSFLTLHIH